MTTTLAALPSPLVGPLHSTRSLVPADLRLPGLTVVLPCFDEEPNVAGAVAEALAAAARCASAVEVVVVDDGSRDGTRAVAERLAAADRRVKVVVHPVNRGYGAAVRSGIDASRMPWVLLTDADLQFDLAELDDLLPLADGHDVVWGYRVGRDDPLGRRLAAAGWNWLMRRTFSIDVRDVDCAFKLFRGPLVRGLPLVSDGAMISTELYVRATRAGARRAEAGVHHRARQAGEASGGDPRVVVRAFAERRRLARELAGRLDGDAQTGPAATEALPGGGRSLPA